ncbi:hypothetical protein BW731_07045 [Vagococcus martis]|uniref:Uncharacterized protein n=1 Tax=Vagococcus martis TaxID=1768210 RepID=A0A1V4DHK5_9ENTE|nr:hypothetical protein [Vagococcus martis]OPF87942.1 hypothetical protein BW731_07045 [Vagococcus martis]
MNKKTKNLLTIIAVSIVTLFTGSIVYANAMPHYQYQDDTTSWNQKEERRDNFHNENARQTERRNNCHQMMDFDGYK